VENFDKIFPDFDLLESQLLITDSEDNKDIFAKYVFTKGNSETYNLIKIYSPVQPHQGHRIEGCIYGIAFLSKENLSISKNNIKALKSIQNKFSNEALIGIKFKQNDFRRESILVYNDFNSNIGFESIERTNQFNNNLSKKTLGIFVNHLTEFDLDVSKYSERIYITEDIERLKRAKNKWGKHKINIIQVENNQIKEFESSQIPNSLIKNISFHSNESGNEQQLLKIRLQDLETQFSFSEQQIKSLIQKNKKNIKYKIILIFIIILLVSFLAIILTTDTLQGNRKAFVKEHKNSFLKENISIKTSLTIDNSFEIINLWDNKNDYAKIINLIIKLDTEKNQGIRNNYINEIFKISSSNKLDTTKVRIILKNYQINNE
jgi:hypothetical protein